LRPLWNIRLAYKLPNSDAKYYKSTFESITIPKKKLSDLLEFINHNEHLLYGQVYNPNYKSSEKFFKNSSLMSLVNPVYMLKNIEKQKLEVMERNSLKNLR
jgi:hypothetical protein